MAENLSPHRSVGIAPPERQGDSPTLQARLHDIALLITQAGAEAVALSCVTTGVETSLDSFAASSRWRPVIESAKAALANRMLDAEIGKSTIIQTVLSRAQLAPIDVDADKTVSGARLYAANLSGDKASVSVVAVLIEQGASLLKVMLQLGMRAAFAECLQEAEVATTEYWRKSAADLAAHAEDSIKALDEISERSRFSEGAARMLSHATSAERYQRLAEVIAGAGSFHDSMVARLRDERWEALSSSRSLGLGDLDQEPIADCLANRQVGIRDGRVYLPIDDVVVVLGFKGALDDGVRQRLELLAGRLGDVVRIWNLEAKDAERRALVHRMGLRLYAAIDEERARIARDLHDDQAQLLTAARIALEGGRDEARAILKRVEEELRRRTRELKPSALGSASLEEQINHELERLAAAGIGVRYEHGAGANRISRPIQQLCYQVTREAVSNVIRHAHAHSVQVRIERLSGGARVLISDDGAGMDQRRVGDGIGLAGVRERVEFLGGKLTIESSERGTIVTADIPEPSG